MKKCILFCAGEFTSLAAPVEKQDLVIAADGGLRHTQALGLTPDIILGDFDSLGYVPEKAQQFPAEKDDTDTMLAVRRGLALGCREFILYGGMDGRRLDHTLANFQTLQFLADHGARGFLIGREYAAAVVKNGCLSFDSRAEGIVSVFCMGADAKGVTLQGLKYPLTQGTLSAGFPLGVSNRFLGERASLSVAQGSLLVLFGRKNFSCIV